MFKGAENSLSLLAKHHSVSVFSGRQNVKVPIVCSVQKLSLRSQELEDEQLLQTKLRDLMVLVRTPKGQSSVLNYP